MRLPIQAWVRKQLCTQTPDQMFKSVPQHTELFAVAGRHPDILYGGLSIEFANRLYLEISNQTGLYPISTTPLMHAVRLAEALHISRHRRVIDVGCGLGNLSYGIKAVNPHVSVIAYDNLPWCVETSKTTTVAETVWLRDALTTPLPLTHYVIINPPTDNAYQVVAGIASKMLWRSILGTILPGRPGEWFKHTPEAYLHDIDRLYILRAEALPIERGQTATTLYVLRKQTAQKLATHQ